MTSFTQRAQLTHFCSWLYEKGWILANYDMNDSGEVEIVEGAEQVDTLVEEFMQLVQEANPPEERRW